MKILNDNAKECTLTYRIQALIDLFIATPFETTSQNFKLLYSLLFHLQQ